MLSISGITWFSSEKAVTPCIIDLTESHGAIQPINRKHYIALVNVYLMYVLYSQHKMVRNWLSCQKKNREIGGWESDPILVRGRRMPDAVWRVTRGAGVRERQDEAFQMCLIFQWSQQAALKCPIMMAHGPTCKNNSEQRSEDHWVWYRMSHRKEKITGGESQEGKGHRASITK